MPDLFTEAPTRRRHSPTMTSRYASEPARPLAALLVPSMPPEGPLMPQKAWRLKREGQCAHATEKQLDRGKLVSLTEEIAARVVNREGAQHGEPVQGGPSSITNTSADRRRGDRSHQPRGDRTQFPLCNEARQRGLTGLSTMNMLLLGSALPR